MTIGLIGSIPIEIIFKILDYIDDNTKFILFVKSKFYHEVIMKYKGFKKINLINIYGEMDKILGYNTKGNGKYSIIRNMNFRNTSLIIEHGSLNIRLFVKSLINEVIYSHDNDTKNNFCIVCDKYRDYNNVHEDYGTCCISCDMYVTQIKNINWTYFKNVNNINMRYNIAHFRKLKNHKFKSVTIDYISCTLLRDISCEKLYIYICEDFTYCNNFIDVFINLLTFDIDEVILMFKDIESMDEFVPKNEDEFLTLFDEIVEYKCKIYFENELMTYGEFKYTYADIMAQYS